MIKKNLIYTVVYVVLSVLICSYIALDYFVLNPVVGIRTGISYWISVVLNIMLILTAMLLTRYVRKSKKIEENQNIADYQSKLNTHFQIIANNALYEDLEKYIKDYNENVKYATLIKQMDKKISKTKKIKKKKKYIALRNTPKLEVLKMNVRYTKISSSKLYSNVTTKVSDDPNQITIKDGIDLLKLLSTKAIFIIIGALFTGSIVYDAYCSGVSTILGTVLKLIMMASGIFVSIVQTDKFVDGEIESVLRKRMRISISFINSSDDIKSLFGLSDKKVIVPNNTTSQPDIPEQEVPLQVIPVQTEIKEDVNI